jgi:hypothetical protein
MEASVDNFQAVEFVQWIEELNDWRGQADNFCAAIHRLRDGWQGATDIVLAGSQAPEDLKSAILRLCNLGPQIDLPMDVRAMTGGGTQLVFCMPERAHGSISIMRVTCRLEKALGGVQWERAPMLVTDWRVLDWLRRALPSSSVRSVMGEVHSACQLAISVQQAAQQAGVVRWPVPTTCGVMICESSSKGRAPRWRYWVQRDKLFSEWARISEDLRAVARAELPLVDERDCLSALLRLHALQPGTRLLRREVDQPSRVDTPADAPHANESNGPNASDRTAEIAEPHRLKARERTAGVVIQHRSEGSWVLSLPNGQFGVLRLSDDRSR